MATEFAGHPYANDPDGTPDDLKSLTPQKLKQRAAALLMRNDLIVAAVGDIDEAELGRLLDKAFGSLPVATPPALPPDWQPPTRPRTVVVERSVPQSTALMALPGIARDDPDWYAALTLNHILGGGGQQSRLFSEVREKRGLAYGVSSGLRVYRKAALLVISTASANERVAEAIRVVRAELARLRTEGPTEQEFTDAKTYLTGALALSLDSSSAIASLLHSMQVDNLPPDHLTRRAALIGAVKIDDVRRMARRLLHDETMTTIVVGKPVGIVADP
jgi:zinc protease